MASTTTRRKSATSYATPDDIAYTRIERPLEEYIVGALIPFAVPIETLVPDPRNARKHSVKNLNAIAKSLATHKQYQPIIVQRDGNIVRAGNGRLAAAKMLGWTHIAALTVESTGAEAISLALTDNWTAETAEWDLQVLLDEVQALQGTGFELPGFDPGDFERYSKELDALHADEADAAILGMDAAQDEPWGSAGGTGDGFDGDGSSAATLSVTLEFDDMNQRERWKALVQNLAKRYPQMQTAAERLDAWIQESEGL